MAVAMKKDGLYKGFQICAETDRLALIKRVIRIRPYMS